MLDFSLCLVGVEDVKAVLSVEVVQRWVMQEIDVNGLYPKPL